MRGGLRDSILAHVSPADPGSDEDHWQVIKQARVHEALKDGVLFHHQNALRGRRVEHKLLEQRDVAGDGSP